MKYIYLPTRVRDFSPPVHATWTLVDIEQKIFSNNCYQLYVYVDDTNTVYMKPYTPYNSREFEELFGFGMICNRYDENKVIQVVAPDNYFRNFQ